MLAQARGELSESKAAELLSMNILQYREKREEAIDAVIALVNALPSGLSSLLAVLKDQPEWFDQSPCVSNSSGKADPSNSTSASPISSPVK